eukprot:SAG31_NODE_1305_length_8893_cov_7.391176_2_plen_152_part_00
MAPEVPQTEGYHFFVSKHEDVADEAAAWLCRRLEQLGYSVWNSEELPVPSDDAAATEAVAGPAAEELTALQSTDAVVFLHPGGPAMAGCAGWVQHVVAQAVKLRRTPIHWLAAHSTSARHLPGLIRSPRAGDAAVDAVQVNVYCIMHNNNA